MCGIAAIFSYLNHAAPIDPGELIRVRDAMTKRGPDAAGQWLSATHRVGLSHRRLSIIDLTTAGTQPMSTPDARLHIVFNGEIYNHLQLRQTLQSQGHVFRTRSDTEVLLHLYAEKGEAMVDALRGMYAFAIWDDVRKELFIARDPFGIKPLYYSDNGTTFRLASQVKALLAGGNVDTTPAPAGHAGFFLWGSVPEPWTLYAGIRSLPAGHSLKVTERGATEPRPFFLITDVLRDALDNPATGNRREALEVIGTALRDSVNAHIIADVPVGLFLSAGLDSSMITSLACETGNKPRTLTLSFQEYAGTAQDESQIASQLALRFGSRHTTITVRKTEFEEQCESLLNSMDQPSIDGVNTWFVARAAAQLGMKVALSGVGGDELFGSYPSFREVPLLAQLAKPFAFIPHLGVAFRHISQRLIARTATPKYAGILEYGATLGGAYLLRRGLHMHWELPNVLDPDLARRGWEELNAFQQLNQVVPRFGAAEKNNDRLECRAARTTSSTSKRATARLAVSALEMTYYLRNQLLRDTDWAGMAHSLEIRVPFVDVALLKQIAPWLAAHPDIEKKDVAAAIVRALPDSVLSKPKTGFSVPVREWLQGERQASAPHGLRGWAAYVYRRFASGVT